MSAKFVFRHNDIIYIVGDVPYAKIGKPLSHLDLGILFENEQYIVSAYDETPMNYIVSENPNWFNGKQDDLDDKENIIVNILNPWFSEGKKLHIINDSFNTKMMRYYIIHNQKIYQTLQHFFLVEINDFASVGQEERIIFNYLKEIAIQTNIENYIELIMRELYYRFNHYDKNYYIYNTKSRTFNVYEVTK